MFCATVEAKKIATKNLILLKSNFAKKLKKKMLSLSLILSSLLSSFLLSLSDSLSSLFNSSFFLSLSDSLSCLRFWVAIVVDRWILGGDLGW